MSEAQTPRMQHLARRIDARRREVPSAVHRVAQDGMARGGEMHSNLVSPSRLELHRDERCATEPLENPIVRDGAKAVFSGPGDAAAPIAAVSNEIGVEAAVPRKRAFDDGDVFALDVMSMKEALQIVESLPIARKDQSAGGVAVQSVDDEGDGPPRIAVVQVVEDTGEKRLPFPLGRRDGKQTGRLVDDEEIGVLDENREPRPNAAPLRTARVKRELRLIVDLPPRLVARSTGQIDPSGPHRVSGGPARESESASDRQIESHR